LVFSTVGVISGATSSRACADTITVYVFDFDYSINRPGEGPIQDAVINVGDTVRWEWLGDFHTVTSCAGNLEVFDSGIFDTGDSFEQTFNTVGTWSYYCIPHGVDLGNGTAIGMAGTVTVVPVPSVLVAGAVGAVALAGRRRR
jgi:plastocyanin